MKFGLAFRLGLLLTVIGILAAGVTGYYAYEVSRDLLIRSAKNELLTSTKVLARRVAVTREEISRNLQELANHPASIVALRKHDPAAEQRLATLFELMMAANPRYFEVRLISADDHGMERVRVDRDGDRLVRVTGDDLQEKGHFAYVYDTLKLPAGRTFMSRIVINHESGAHSGLGQPTVILAMPVVDPKGGTLGVVVINVDLNGMFALLEADLPKNYQLFFANRDGDYLIHPDPTQAFGFDKGRRVLVQDEFPATSALVEGKADQVFVEAHEGRYAEAPIVAAFIGRHVSVASDESQVILGLAQPLSAVLLQAESLARTTLRIVVGICLACILLAALMARAVTRPINAMTNVVRDFTGTQPCDKLPLERSDEIGALARSFDGMKDQIRRQLDELERSRLEMEHLARHDRLTGLPNRALFDDRFEQAQFEARRDKTGFALVFIDVDRFKPVNDNLGHAVGDQLLKEIAHRIELAIRDSDTAARIGGDEFVVLLRDIRDSALALSVAEKIRKAVGLPFVVDENSIDVSVSIGIALYPEHGDDILELSKHADEAMYGAKEGGRDRVVLYEPPETV